MLVSDLGDSLDVWDVVLGVSNTLDVDGLGFIINGSGQVLRLVTDDELGVDAQSWEEDLQLVVGSSVEVRRRHDVVAGMCEGRDSHELSGLTRAGCDGGHAALEGRKALLKDVDGGLWRGVSGGP